MKDINRLKRENRTHKQYIQDSDLTYTEILFLLIIAESIALAHFIVTPVVYAYRYYNNKVLEEAVSEIRYRNLYERGGFSETE